MVLILTPHDEWFVCHVWRKFLYHTWHPMVFVSGENIYTWYIMFLVSGVRLFYYYLLWNLIPNVFGIRWQYSHLIPNVFGIRWHLMNNATLKNIYFFKSSGASCVKNLQMYNIGLLPQLKQPLGSPKLALTSGYLTRMTRRRLARWRLFQVNWNLRMIWSPPTHTKSMKGLI